MMRRTKDERKTAGKIIALFAVAGMLAGCGGKTGTTPDDYATNDGYITTETAGNSTGGAQSDTTSGTAGISKENIKVGVLYIQIRMREADILTRMIWELWECRKIWV